MIPSYYNATIGGQPADMYAIALAHNITDPAVCHAIKYMLRAGKKSGETKAEAIQKAIASLERGLDLGKERALFLAGAQVTRSGCWATETQG